MNFPIGNILFFSFVFLFIIAFGICLRTLFLCDYVGLNKLTSAYGLMSISVGIASGIATPICAIIIEHTDYATAFVIVGLTFIIGGLSILILKYFCKEVE